MAKQKPDPQHAGAKPPFPQEPQEYPGAEAEMTPEADHGEASYIGHDRLKGQGTLVTGADSGIGRAVALAFAREGADVLISYLEEEKDARETARLVEDAGRRAIVVRGDIGDEKQCRKLVDQTLKEFGRLDVLVNNAAFQSTHESLGEFTPEEVEHTFRTNVFAMYNLCRLAVPHMKPGASIINVGSIQGYNPSPTLLAYAPTKAAIINYTKALAQFAIKQGIRVNCVAPGPVWTPLIPSTMPEDALENFGKDAAFERPAQPAELAPIFVFLASSEASYVTGEVYAATGGKTPY